MTRSDDDWVSIGEYGNYQSARIISHILGSAAVPHRLVRAAMPLEDPTCWIWVPPKSEIEAKRVLAECAVPEEELTNQALKFPPPDDA